MKSILGQKGKMSQIFSKDGEKFPVTEITAGPCEVLFQRTPTKDGYWGLGLGLGKKKKNRKRGALQKERPLFLREIRITEGEEVAVGEKITVNQVFEPGDLIDITGVSKGFGFTGVVKRYHFKGGPRTHGQSDRERAPGSIGSSTTPGRVLKGKRMAGREGQNQTTLKNLLVLKVDGENNQVLVKGAVPGKPKGLLILEKTGIKAKTIEEIS